MLRLGYHPPNRSMMLDGWSNIHNDPLQCYLDNWAMILKVCEEHRDDIDSKIAKKVRDIKIKRNAEDYLIPMKPIAVALDKVQSDSEAVEVWKALEREIDSLQLFDVAQ